VRSVSEEERNNQVRARRVSKEKQASWEERSGY